MANGLNQCNFIGNLGSDPETRQAGATSVCNFSIGVSSSWTDKSGQKQERTEWVRVAAWGKLGEICQQYLHKGKQCFISGELRTEKYQDKTSGEDRYSTSIIARDMQLLGGRSDGQQAPRQASAPQAGGAPVGGDEAAIARAAAAVNAGGAGMDDSIPFNSVQSYP